MLLVYILCDLSLKELSCCILIYFGYYLNLRKTENTSLLRKKSIKQLLDEVEHDIKNYQDRGLCYLPKPKAEADNTDTRF